MRLFSCLLVIVFTATTVFLAPGAVKAQVSTPSPEPTAEKKAAASWQNVRSIDLLESLRLTSHSNVCDPAPLFLTIDYFLETCNAATDLTRFQDQVQDFQNLTQITSGLPNRPASETQLGRVLVSESQSEVQFASALGVSRGAPRKAEHCRDRSPRKGSTRCRRCRHYREFRCRTEARRLTRDSPIETSEPPSVPPGRQFGRRQPLARTAGRAAPRLETEHGERRNHRCRAWISERSEKSLLRQSDQHRNVGCQGSVPGCWDRARKPG